MEDKFTKRFREMLNQRPLPTFQEKDWDALQHRLPAVPPASPGLHWRWVALPLLVLLLGSNAWWYREKRQSDVSAKAADTLYQTKVIYDTLYIRQLVALDQQPAFSFGGSEKPSLFQPYQLPANLWSHRPPTTPNTQVQLPWPDQGLYSLPYIWPQLPQLAPPVLPLATTGSKQSPSTVKRTMPSTRLKLDDSRLGITGGGTYTRHPDFGTAAGYLLGSEASLRLSDYLRLWTEAGYLRSIYETARPGSSIPEVQPPIDGYFFDEVEISQPGLQFTLGLRYAFATQMRLQPFVGIGYSLLQPLGNELIYDFSSPIGGQKLQYEISGSAPHLQANYFLLQAGFYYPLSQRWGWQLQLSQRARWWQSGQQQFSLQTGLHYRLKK